MRLFWPASARIRSFYDPASHRLTIVSDVVDDEAKGRVYGSRLAISVSADGVLRDLELLSGPLAPPRSGVDVAPSYDVDKAIVVWLPETDEPGIEECPGSTAVTVRLASDEPERWARLGGSGVVLGLVEDDVLVAICVDPQVDPEGEREAQWLDSLSD